MSTLFSLLAISAPVTNISWLDTLINAVIRFLNPILILVAIAGIIYAIVVGIKFAKAEDKSQRDEAKQKLITVLVGILVTIVLIVLFYFLAFNIDKIIEIESSNISSVTT